MKRATNVLRRSHPPVVVNGITITSGLPTMIVFLKPTRRIVRLFEQFTHARNIGWKAIAPGHYLCAGGFDNLLALTDRYFVMDWHWETNAHVCRASGAGDKPKPPAMPKLDDPATVNQDHAAWNRYLKEGAEFTQERRKELAASRPERRLCWKRHGC